MASTHLQSKPGQAGTTQHPRRLPAHLSVSLRHQAQPPMAQNDTDGSSNDSNTQSRSQGSSGKKDASPSSLVPGAHHSSGESSNVDRWFDKSNNNITDSSAFADNDPPFFMRNSSSSDTPPEAQSRLRQFLQADSTLQSLPIRNNLLPAEHEESSTEDFRSVIDDLTVENKKLKRKLRKYEQTQGNHLKDEKLFEVRIHGLPAEKKRELEEMLQKFTASMGNNNFPPSGYESLLPMLGAQKTVSSQTSFQNADSAYYSMSASGQGSSSQSGSNTKQKARAQNAASRHQNIHSYLSQVPQGLLSQANPATMTERAKQKLVVRRLEQIFAGKSAVASQHPLQQQEVSQMAARADQVANEARGQGTSKEGTREASIMHREVPDPANPANDNPDIDEGLPAEMPASDQPRLTAEQRAFVEQRPTRPLDLDPHRAQVPTDNIDYIRHLGFSPSDVGRSPVDDHGWIYLNLLINMAQLHTINVTSEFVRKAISEHSQKFEMSSDGRKIRWRGGRNFTKSSSVSGGDTGNSRTDGDTPDGQSPRKRIKLSQGVRTRTGPTALLRVPENKLDYTPLVFRQNDTDDTAESSSLEDDETSSPFHVAPGGDSSGITSSGIRTTSTKKRRKREDGPIIFYNSSRFCTDLSGEQNPRGNFKTMYKATNVTPIGQAAAASNNEPSEKRGPLAYAHELPEPMDLGDNPIPKSLELTFPVDSRPISSKVPEIRRMEMEVTGIGGVYPADNFAVMVDCRHARIEQHTRADTSIKSLPPRFENLLHGSQPARKPQPFKSYHEVLSAGVTRLPPSPLPPALSRIPFGDEDDSDSDDSDMDERYDVDYSPGSSNGDVPGPRPQPMDLHYTSSSSDEVDDDDSDDESDGSLDLLAVAREVDPEAIRKKEREYDANMAERLAEEIPAGSSAATAGGGSGFASPASDMPAKEYEKAVKGARARAAARRPIVRQSSNTAVHDFGHEESDEEDDGDAAMSDIRS